jgi:hypothetical protein
MPSVAVCYDSAEIKAKTNRSRKQLKQLRPLILRRFTALSPHFFTDVPPFCRTFAGFDAADKLLLPARNKQILPGLPLIRLHQE